MLVYKVLSEPYKNNGQGWLNQGRKLAQHWIENTDVVRRQLEAFEGGVEGTGPIIEEGLLTYLKFSYAIYRGPQSVFNQANLLRTGREDDGIVDADFVLGTIDHIDEVEEIDYKDWTRIGYSYFDIAMKATRSADLPTACAQAIQEAPRTLDEMRVFFKEYKDDPDFLTKDAGAKTATSTPVITEPIFILQTETATPPSLQGNIYFLGNPDERA